jgi:hypothetical protein
MNDKLPLSIIARFSADGRVYSAFGYYIAAGHGYVLLVPVGAAYEDCAIDVVQGSPVPVEEISALINEPLYRQHELGHEFKLWPMFAVLCDSGWHYDMVPIMPGAWRAVLRATNENGIRYAEVPVRSPVPNDRSAPADTEVPWP